MISKKFSLLTIGFNYREINLIQDELSKEFFHFDFDFAISVQDSIYRLNLSDYDIVLIDLTNSDSENSVALKEIDKKGSDTTLIVTVNSNDVSNSFRVNPRYFVVKDENFAVKLAGYIKKFINDENSHSDVNLRLTPQAYSFFQNLIDTVHDRIMIVGLDYRIKSVNKQLLERYDCSLKDVVGRYCFEFVYHFDNPCSENDMPCPLKQISADGQSCQMVHTYHRSQNSQSKKYHISAFPLTNEFNMNVEILIAVHEETTSQAVSYDNRLLHVLVNGLSEGLVFCDSEDNVVLINQAAEKLLNINREQILGTSVVNLPIAQGLHWLTKVLQTAKSNIDVTIAEKLKLNEKWVTLQFAPLYQDNDTYVGGILYVTERTSKQESKGLETDLISLSKFFSSKVIAEG